MGRVSQRHRLEVTGLDSSGRGPLPGTNYIEQAQAIEILEANATKSVPACISLQGDVFAGTETIDVQFTAEGEAQVDITVNAVAGNAFDQIPLLVTDINQEDGVLAVANGKNIKLFAVDASETVVVDAVLIS